MAWKFQNLKQFTRVELDAAIARNALDELPLVPITVALLSEDVETAQDVCVRLAAHPNVRVRANALTALGHLARRFRKLDEGLIRPLLESALIDSDELVRAAARSSSDEIHQFLHWKISGHIYG